MAGVYGNIVLKESVFSKIEDKRKEKEFKKEVESSCETIKYIEKWLENGKNYFHSYHIKLVLPILLFIYKIPEKRIINHILNFHQKESLSKTYFSYINSEGQDKENLDRIISKYASIIPELKSLDEENVINIVGHDEWQVYIGIKSKKIFELDFSKEIRNIDLKITDLNKMAKKFESWCNKEAIIEADAILGYYKLSDCPKGTIKKKFPI